VKNNALLKKTYLAFNISENEIEGMIKAFHREMNRGLRGIDSSLKMLPAYVGRPSGLEKGEFIALDLGGTHFRVLEIGLLGDGRTRRPVVERYTLKDKHIQGKGDVLFDFLADCIKAFMQKNKMSLQHRFNIGFTFSFPVHQSGIDSGTLISWTKGFKARGVEGQDVVLLLNKALARKGLINVRVTALANDTVGTLVAEGYNDPQCDIGVILGTGTNACYPEKTSRIYKLTKKDKQRDEMIINIEWGNFNKIRITSYDRKVDRASGNPEKQRMEKMVSGMYLGELARMVVKHFVVRKQMFKGKYSSVFGIPNNFKTKVMSLIESDASKSLSTVNAFLVRSGIHDSEYKDRKMLKDICMIVSTRAARISAAAIAAVLTQMDPSLERRHTVAIDGTVYEKYTGFSFRIEQTLKKYFKAKAKKLTLRQAKDGSGKGVAIIAAIAAP